MKYGLLGETLSHSFSKEIHEQLADYTYDLIPVDNADFPAFMEHRDFQAINVTIPYKEKVIPYLAEMDEQATAIQAVNTIVNHEGKLYGYNTDFDGFLYTLKHYHIAVKHKKVLVLGYGGASKAVLAVLNHLEAGSITIVNRTQYEATISYEECYQTCTDAAVIINTTSVGMYPKTDISPLDLTLFKKCEAVIDIIYNPLKTRLLLDAERLGIPACNGLKMLVAQAKYAVEHFQNTPIDDARIDEVSRTIKQHTQNIVLIGMPSVGKTTVGRQLSRTLNRTFIDLDKKLVAACGMSIPDYFQSYGEAAFRDRESDICRQYGNEKRVIIATGGGVVLRPENIRALRANGLLIWLRRPLSKLISDETRPLSSSQQAIEKLYRERLPLYEKAADITIDNDQSLKHTIDLILNTLKNGNY